MKNPKRTFLIGFIVALLFFGWWLRGFLYINWRFGLFSLDSWTFLFHEINSGCKDLPLLFMKDTVEFAGHGRFDPCLGNVFLCRRHGPDHGIRRPGRVAEILRLPRPGTPHRRRFGGAGE